MTSMTRRGALSAVLALAAAPAAAQSQRYPTRFIRLLVGFAPGGAVDTVARVLAEEMSKGLGQRIVVENRAGASGNLRAGFQNSRARRPATRNMQALCSSDWTTKPSRS